MRWYKVVTDVETWDATGDPYALNVEFDIPVVQELNPGPSGCFVRIWGIPLETVKTARKFNNVGISVYGGMQKGLPLADPSQQGLLVKGKIYPCLGNWVGTDMTLDFNIANGPGSGVSNFGQPNNVIHNWPANTWLGDSIKQTLKTALPKLTPVIDIDKNLKLPYNDYGFYQTTNQFFTYIRSISKTIINDKKYYGVRSNIHGDKVYVYDGKGQTDEKEIKFTDLVGQPIWIDINRIQVKTIMRGDLRVGMKVKMPKSLAGLGSGLLGSGGAINQSNASNTLQGTFWIEKIRHTGNFRQADGLSWITTFEAIDINTSEGAAAGGTGTGR